MRIGRVLITGCGGMLGSAVYPYFLMRYRNVLATDKVVDEKWLSMLDVRDDAAVSRIFNEYKPTIVLHLAAETDLEYCETHADNAVDTNSRATKTIATFSEQHGATLVYISTAGVFDGSKEGFYSEDDQPKPIMVYGQSKYDGEIHALKHCSKSFVVRAGWMMGGGRNKEKKFIYKILKQVKAGKKEIFAVNDRWGTPTYTYDFAMNLFHLMDSERYGVYHMVCEGMGNRYDVANEILHICKRDDIALTPVDSSFFKEEYFVTRPRSEMLINARLAKNGLNQMRPWKDALKDYINNYFYDYIAKSSSLTERRKHYRKECAVPVIFSIVGETEMKTYPGVCVDACVSGSGLITNKPLRIDQIIKFSVKDVSGHVRDTKTVPIKATEEMKYRIGLESIDAGHYLVTSIFKLKKVSSAPEISTSKKALGIAT